ncbi:VOC family protein [Aeromicrobium sp. Marseille-Q0843]|uniref:VOC family protein n=1 Tax=Aeromicrobium phoceense TaxID=2754045 RepID=A0A838XPM4_9ACTN|nr:VOC family protein [Aeromicrobium phoceense]MBA4608964.1 VOC family protein [Aeromicrobium phoceense]
MAINTYLFFSGGTCAEAFERYRDILGGDLSITRMSEVPQDSRMPGSDPDSVMHAALVFGDRMLMGSDDPTGDGGPRLGFSVAYTAPDTETAQRVFGALAEGGETTMPLEPTFWSAAFGTCTDRYGVPWMVDVASGAA